MHYNTDNNSAIRQIPTESRASIARLPGTEEIPHEVILQRSVKNAALLRFSYYLIAVDEYMCYVIITSIEVRLDNSTWEMLNWRKKSIVCEQTELLHKVLRNGDIMETNIWDVTFHLSRLEGLNSWSVLQILFICTLLNCGKNVWCLDSVYGRYPFMRTHIVRLW